jgi:hypothetical protein
MLVGYLMVLALLSVSHILCADEQGLEESRRKLASDDYEARKSAVTAMIEAGKSRHLSKEEIDLPLPCLKSDSRLANQGKEYNGLALCKRFGIGY